MVCGWGAFCLAADALAAEPADKPASHTVAIEGVAYQPAVLVVKRGDTVAWVNKDPFPHTVTAPGAFDSHDIAAGATWKHVARNAGSLSVHLHASSEHERYADGAVNVVDTSIERSAA